MPLTSGAALGDPQGVWLARPTATPPATTTTTYFNVVGIVEILDLYGVVTTTIQAQADAIKFRFTPTGGSVGDVSGTIDINGLDAGSVIQVQGPTTAGAVSQSPTGPDLTGGTGRTLGQGTGSIVLKDGALALNAAATNTGSIQWFLRYRAKKPGSYVTVA